MPPAPVPGLADRPDTLTLCLVRHGRTRLNAEGRIQGRADSELTADVLHGSHPGFPGGESARAYLDRVTAAFTRIEAAHGTGENVLVVSHGMTLAVWLWLTGTAQPEPLPNASVTVVRVAADGTRTAPVVGAVPADLIG